MAGKAATKRYGFPLLRDAVLVRGQTLKVNLPKAIYRYVEPYLDKEYFENVVRHAPSRKVAVDTFAIDRYCVTNSEFKRFIEQLQCVESAMIRSIDFQHWKQYFRAGDKREDAPVTTVTLAEARIFAWINGGRLPTEEEWELAAQPMRNSSKMEKLGVRINQQFVEWSQLDPFPFDRVPSVFDDDAHESRFGVRGLFGGVDEIIDSGLDLNLTHLTDLKKKMRNGTLSSRMFREHIVKQCGFTELVQLRGARGFAFTEFFSLHPIYGGATRYPNMGFRCCYTVRS